MNVILLILLVLCNSVYLLVNLFFEQNIEIIIWTLIIQSAIWTYLFTKQSNLFSNKVLFSSLLFSLLLVKSSTPVFENDFIRYFWDGTVSLHGSNPYEQPPQKVEGISALKALSEKIQYADLRTIYPPLAQIIFLVSVAMSWFNLTIFTFLISILGFACFLYFFRIFLKKQTLTLVHSPSYTLLFIALHPLLMREWLQAIHYDSWVAAFVILLLCSNSKKLFAINLGLLIQLKASFLILLPMLLNPSFKRSLKNGYWLAISMTVVSLPFIVDFDKYVLALLEFSKLWEMNSGIYRLIRETLTQTTGDMNQASSLSRSLVFSLSLLIASLIFLNKKISSEEKVFWTTLALILLSPVVNPWYFSWILPLVVIFERKVQLFLWPIFCFLPLSYYFYDLQLKPYGFLIWWNIEHIGIMICLFLAITFRINLGQQKIKLFKLWNIPKTYTK